MENDAISRSELLKLFPVNLNAPFWHVTGIRAAIGSVDALDVASVVYCKDCVYARPLTLIECLTFDSDCFVCTSEHGAGTYYPERNMNGNVVFPKAFCSYGRRKNGR